jgi:hypothetical protein
MALRYTEIPGANDSTNEDKRNRNTTSDSSATRVAFKLLAKSIPALEPPY